jgi:hypothetical protein
VAVVCSTLIHETCVVVNSFLLLLVK